MKQFFNTIELVTLINGICAALACMLVLYTISRTCRFVRRPKLQDTMATGFQDLLHISLFSSVFLMAVDHLAELGGVRSLLTDYLSPPLSDFFMVLTVVGWSGFKLRKNWFQRQGLDLSEDLRVIKKVSDETIDSHN